MKRPKLLKKRLGRSIQGDIMNFLILLIVGSFMLLPMLFVIGNAFKPLDELFVYPPRLFVRNPTTQNFSMLSTIFVDSWVPFSRYIFNTVFITAAATAGQVIIASMAGYVLEKKRFFGRKAVFEMVKLSLMFAGGLTAIPNYVIMSRIGWIDTYASIIVPAAGSTIGVFLMKQFMSNLHDTILDAARVDGAGEQRIFWCIAMPNVKPAWLTLIIFTVQNTWGTTGGSYIYREELKTLPYALNQIVSSGISRTGAGASVSLLMMIIPVLVFVVTQRNVLQTMMSSGIKE